MAHEIKVGDRVRLVRNDAPFATGEVATAVEVDDDTLTRLTHKLRNEQGVEAWVFTDSVEYLGPGDETASFKVGDKVRVIDHRPSDTKELYWNPAMDACLGKEGVVKRVNGNIAVKFPDGYWWYKPSWLTLMESEARPALSNPLRYIRKGAADVFDGLFACPHRTPSTDKLPLIDTTKLLTSIKLD